MLLVCAAAADPREPISSLVRSCLSAIAKLMDGNDQPVAGKYIALLHTRLSRLLLAAIQEALQNSKPRPPPVFRPTKSRMPRFVTNSKIRREKKPICTFAHSHHMDHMMAVSQIRHDYQKQSIHGCDRRLLNAPPSCCWDLHGSKVREA